MKNYYRFRNPTSILGPFRPILRLLKRVWPYINAGLPILFLLAFIGINVFIWWYGPKFEWGGEYPLKTVTSRFLLSVVITLFILVIFAFFQRKEMQSYYKAKKADELFESDIRVQYVERQKVELNKVMSHIKDHYRDKDYLYGLPWYMVVGLNASGKTSLINRSGQEFLFSTALKAGEFKSENPSTFNWWINDEAIFIDPDSDLLSQSPASDLKEGESDPQISRHLWLSFIEWLGATRSRRPLNGIILTVDISYLANANIANRKVYAGILRARISEIMESLSSRLPVYVVFTKLDLLHGFSEFFKNCTKAEREALFGFTFSLKTLTTTDAWLKEFDGQFTEFMTRVNNLLPKLLMETRSEEERGALYSFTRQLSGLESIIHRLLKEVLISDKFTTSPIVRGVYLTTVYQQGVPNDVFVNASSKRYNLEYFATRAQNNLNSTPYFTQDLFDKVVFKESGLASDNMRLQENKRRQLVTAGIIGSVASILSIVVFHYYFTKNTNSLGNVRENVLQFNKVAVKDQLDPTGKILEKPLNLIRAATLEFGYFHDRAKYLSDVGLYLGHKVGPEVEKTYLRLLAYRYLPSLISGVAKDLSEVEASSDEQLELLRIFRMMINKRARHPEMIMDYFSRYWQGVFEGNAELQDNLMKHLDYALKHTDLDYDRSVKIREAERALAPYDNLVLKSQQELVVIPMEQRVYRSFKRYGMTILGSPLDLRLAVGPAFDIIFDIPEKQQENIRIPRLFTKEGVDKYYMARSENISELALIDNWVIGQREKIDFSEEDIAVFREKLREQYGTDYEQYWRSALNALNIKEFIDINHGVLILDNIVGTTQPFQRMLASLKENTKIFPNLPEEDKAREEFMRSNAYILSSKISTDFFKLNELTESMKVSTADSKPAFIDEVIGAIQNLQSLLKYIQNAQDVGQVALKTAKDRIELTDADPIYALKRIAERLPQPMNSLVEKLADESWNVILLEAIKEIDHRWNNEVYKEFNTVLGDKYPFNAQSKVDVSLEEFEHFFGEQGTINKFYDNELKPFLNESLFKNKQGDAYRSLIKEQVIAQLENSQKIRRAFFNQRGVLGIEFSLSPISMGPQVQRSLLNIEGQYVEYTHGPRRKYALIWPNTINKNTNETVVKLTMIGARANQTHSVLTFTGPWALFRMFDHGSISNVDNNTLNISFSMRNIAMRYQLVAQGEMNPFTVSLLRSFKLSPSLYK